jgi:hypothetical protein
MTGRELREALPACGQAANLHAFWDVTTVAALGRTPRRYARL